MDMACPVESNIEEKLREKRTKYQQLAFEIRERRPGYTVEVIPFVIGCLGGGMKKLEEQMAKLIPEKLQRLRITREMQKLVLMESETIVRKITSGIVQPECCIVTMSKASIFWYLLSHSPVCVRGVGCGPQWGLLINNNNNLYFMKIQQI